MLSNSALVTTPDFIQAIEMDSGTSTPILQEIRNIGTCEGHVNVLALTPGGRFILTGGWNKTLLLFDLNTGGCLRAFAGHEEAITALAVLPHGRLPYREAGILPCGYGNCKRANAYRYYTATEVV